MLLWSLSRGDWIRREGEQRGWDRAGTGGDGQEAADTPASLTPADASGFLFAQRGQGSFVQGTAEGIKDRKVV